MSKKRKMLWAVFYMLTGSAFTGYTVSAYIDPATTSYVIQIVVGIVIACGTAIGIFWNKIKRKFKKKDSKAEPAASPKTDDNDKGGVITAEDLLDDGEK